MDSPPRSSAGWKSRRCGRSSTVSCGVAWRNHERSRRPLSTSHSRSQPQSAELQAAGLGEPPGRGQQPAVRRPHSVVRAARRRCERTGQAGGLFRGAGISEPDQVCEPRVARAARGAPEPRRARDDRVGQRLLMLDTSRIRPDFPILAQQENGHRLVYLDNAATSQKPRKVIDAIVQYYTFHNANVHRGEYALAVAATDAYEAARTAVARFVNAWAREGVVFTRGTTESINLVAGTWGRANVRRGDTVVVTAMDHHSNIVPWQILCQEKGATLRMVEITEDGRIDLSDFGHALEAKPKI